MDSRTRMEKVYEVKFTTATSAAWELATGLWAAPTFSASPAPPRQALPSPPRPQRPASLPPAGRPSSSSRIRAYSRERGLALGGQSRNRARALAPGGLSCACAGAEVRVRRPHE